MYGSLYGGKQGRSYKIVAHYDSIYQMVTEFQKGPTYTDVGFVDAYDRELYEANRDMFDKADMTFPFDVDKDGNGYVYYITTNIEEYEGEIQPFDDDEYLRWLHKYTDGTNKISPVFFHLSEETISHIGDKEYFEQLKESDSESVM